MRDKLVQISENDWKELRDLYLINWPQNCVGYYTVDNFIRWIEKDKNIRNLNFYSLNGDWSDGTFLIVDRYQLFINSLNQSNDRLKIALSLLDWTKGFKVSTFLARHRLPVEQVVESKNLNKEFDSLTALYFMPRSEGAMLQIDLPNGITLRPLSQEHADKINEAWPNAHTGSLFFIKRVIDWNPNIGAFTDDGKLVAWSVRLQAGPLGALQVDENYTRRGYGLLVLKAITKQLAMMDIDTYGCVGIENKPSQGMFEKAGFKVVDHCYWLRTYPLIKFEWTDD